MNNLWNLVQQGDTQVQSINDLLHDGVTPNFVAPDGQSPLLFATNNKQALVCQVLLQWGAYPDHVGPQNLTAPSVAAFSGSDGILYDLCRYGADPAQMFGPFSLVHLASSQGHDFVVECLLGFGIDANVVSGTGDTALHLACCFGHHEVVKSLLDYGVNVSLRNAQGLTAMELARRNNHLNVVSLINDALPLPGWKPFSLPLSSKSTEERCIDKMNCPNGDSAEIDTSQVNAGLDAILEELESLTGLESVKNEVRRQINVVEFQRLRRLNGLPEIKQNLHVVFTGNPGTGKTTVARLLAKAYYCLGILKKEDIVETDRSGLVAGWLGQTALKVTEQVDKALGGVLFIDEAYALAHSERGRDEFGYEAVDTLVKLMEDHRDDLIVIVAGYTEPMERFISANPGLKSRFNKYIEFPDYSPADLIEVFYKFAVQENYVVSKEAYAKLSIFFKHAWDFRDKTFGNARFARNTFETTKYNQANRVVTSGLTDRVSLTNIAGEDIPNT